eukprot:997777-Pleurochrysis_carterae.AAC.1
MRAGAEVHEAHPVRGRAAARPGGPAGSGGDPELGGRRHRRAGGRGRGAGGALGLRADYRPRLPPPGPRRTGTGGGAGGRGRHERA